MTTEEMIADLEARLAELKEQCAKEKEPWPRIRDWYWFLGAHGNVIKTRHADHALDCFSIDSGNCFHTADEARAYLDQITDPRTVARLMIERCEGFNPVGPWSIKAATLNGSLNIDTWEMTSGGLQFDTRAYAEAVVDKFGDLVRVALGIITGNEAKRIVREAIGK